MSDENKKIGKEEFLKKLAERPAEITEKQYTYLYEQFSLVTALLHKGLPPCYESEQVTTKMLEAGMWLRMFWDVHRSKDAVPTVRAEIGKQGEVL